MKVALIQYELYLNSYDRQHVAGEDIDAKGMKKAFLRRSDVECCDIMSINIIRDRQERGELEEYDLAIHFNHPSIIMPKAVNILFFQQYYEWDALNFDEIIKCYDYVMTPAKAVADEYNIIYFPLAVDTEVYSPQQYSDEFSADVVFVGNRRMRDIDTYDRYLLPAMNYKCIIYGNGWDIEGFEKYRKCWRGILGYSDAAKLYSSSKMSLCIHSRMYTERFHLVTTRSLHSIACNCFVLSDKIEALKEMLPEGYGIKYTDGYSDSERLIKEYLQDVDKRSFAVEKGRKWILANHTWDLRIQQLLDRLKM